MKEEILQPKVLIINQPFNSNSGGGITLTNLFKGWKKDRIAVACLGNLINETTDFNHCTNYYQLGQLEHQWKFPFSLLKNNYYSGPIKPKKTNNTSVKQVSIRSKLLKENISPFLRKVGLSNALSSIEISPNLENWLKGFKPDIIYAQAHRRESVLFCTKLQKHLKIPMVFHMMDDWVGLVNEEGLFGSYWEKTIEREFKEMLSLCSLHFSISDLMADVYQQRYKFNFHTFHNPIEIDFWKKGQKSEYDLSPNPEVLYAGRVGLGIDDSLINMARAITQFNQENRMNVKFTLQVKDKPHWAEKFECVSHRPFVPYEELPYKFGEADILFLPYDFNIKSVKYIRYSMPTKASEFMISGTPILIYSPPETALVNYANEYQWAEVVTTRDIDSLKYSLEQLLTQKELRAEMGSRAISVAEKRHNADTVRKEFTKNLFKLTS